MTHFKVLREVDGQLLSAAPQGPIVVYKANTHDWTVAPVGGVFAFECLEPAHNYIQSVHNCKLDSLADRWWIFECELAEPVHVGQVLDSRKAAMPGNLDRYWGRFSWSTGSYMGDRTELPIVPALPATSAGRSIRLTWPMFCSAGKDNDLIAGLLRIGWIS